MNSKPIFIATRGSALALAQSNMMLAECRATFPGEVFDLKIIKTTGDKLQTASLAAANLPKGLFTKELEVALLNGEGDFAVHSLKDLPTELPDGLKLGAVSKREDVRDVLIYRGPDCAGTGRKFEHGLTVRGLPNGARIATSSTRRRAQLLEQRPDFSVSEIRGNVGTRLRKLVEQPELDAIVLAAAGLRRLGFLAEGGDRLSGAEIPDGLVPMILPLDEMLPCVGQAAIGIESRQNDARIDRVCAALNDATTQACVAAERAFLRGMGGGCQLAVAAHAEITGKELRLRAVSYLGQKPIRGERHGNVSAASELGYDLARELKP